MLIGWAAQNLAPSQQHITNGYWVGRESGLRRLHIPGSRFVSIKYIQWIKRKKRYGEEGRVSYCAKCGRLLLVHLVLLDRERNGIGMFQHSRILSLHLRPFSPFRFFPPSSFFLTCMKYTHTHTLVGSFLLSSRSISQSLFFFYRPISIFQQRNEQTNVEPKRKDFAPEKKKKNVEKVERGSEAEEEKIKRRDFCFSLLLGRRPKRADDDDGINNRDIVDFHVEQHRLES